MPYTIAELTSEINTDPVALGYAPHVAAGRLGAIADLLNTTRPGVGVVFRTNVTAAEIVESVPWAEVATFTTNNWLAFGILTDGGTLDASKVNVRDWFAGVFVGKTAALAALAALARRPAPTRAEELWGAGTTVPLLDVARALGRAV